MRPARQGMTGLKKTAALLALVCTFALQLNGAGATHQSVGGTVPLGHAAPNPDCQFHIGCMPFAGPLVATGVESPNEYAGQCKHAADVHNNSPFTSIVDISAYTGSTRQVEFKLVASQGQGSVHWLMTAIRDANCNKPAAQFDSDVQHRIGVGQARIFTVPKGIKWIIVYAQNSLNPLSLHLNEQWKLTFLH